MEWPTLGLITALLLPPAAVAQLPPARAQGADLQGAIERDNQVVLRHGWGVHSIEFSFQDGRVTGNIPFGGVYSDTREGELRMHVLAPRKGSEEVAQSWRAALDNTDYHMFVLKPGRLATGHPDKLNFWIHGRMRINGIEVPGGVYLGQGHYLTVNNWWFGQSAAVWVVCAERELRFADEQNHLYCLTQGQGSEGSYTFNVDSCLKPPGPDD